jgi:hypothetical protein
MKISESSLFATFSSVSRFNARDIADLTFLYLVTLHILRSDWREAPLAKAYAGKTLSHGDFDDPFINNTDLYQLLYITLQNSNRFRPHLKNPVSSEVLLGDLDLDSHDVKNFLQNTASGHYNDALASRLLLRFERDLRVTVTNYKSVRRIASDWNTSHIDTEAKSLAVTRLLQAMRNRARRGDLMTPLESLAHDQKLEMVNACDPETGTNCNTRVESPPQPRLSLLRQLAVSAGLGLGAYYVGRALAGAFRGKRPVAENASSGATSAGSVASVASPLGDVMRRPSLFGYVSEPEQSQISSQSPPKTKKRRCSNK